ncbi:MAG: serine hydrolase domain-containing protein, partial [Actinomycetota bacterium]
MGTTTSVAAKSVHLRNGLVKGGRLRTWLVRGLLVASVCWLFAACVPRDGHVRSYVGITIPTESISDHVAGRMDELGIPGLSLAIVNDGEVRYAETFGYADVATGEPVTDETIFEGASLSKPVFAMF